MTLVRSLVGWRQQPHGGVGIDWSSPLALGLVVVYAPQIGDVNLVSGGRLTLTGVDSSIHPGHSGIARVWTQESDITRLSETISIPAPWTCLGVIRPDELNELVIWRNRADSTPTGSFRVYSSRANYVIPFLASIGSDTVSPLLTLGRTACVALSVTGAGNPHDYAFYTNGVAGTRGTTTRTTTVGSAYQIGGDSSDNPANQGRKALYLVAVWNRVLSTAEGVSVTANPWQLFAPRRIIVPGGAAAATAPTLSDLRAINVGATSTRWSIDYTFA